MDIMYTFFVDFARPQRTNELLVMQNDNLTRVARFILMNNGSAMEMSAVDSVTVNAVLPDETRITAEATISKNDDDENINEIIFPIPGSMTSALGKTVVTITLYRTITSDQKVISSFEFYINTRNELNRDDSSGDDDYAGIRDLINRALEAVDLVEQIVARESMPNPYPLQIILEGNTYNYDGSVSVRVDMGSIISRITALETAFPNGCRTIARAITAGRGTYESPVDGVSTADNAGPSTMATNIKTLATINYDQGVTDTKAVDPTISTTWNPSERTAGTQTTYQTKTTSAGWTDVNEVHQTLTSTTTAQVNTTGDNQVHDFNVVPNLYHKVKVNQKPAYDSGHAAGYKAGVAANKTAIINSYLLSGSYLAVTSSTYMQIGTRHVTVQPSSGGTVYCVAVVDARCWNNADLYGNGAAFIYFSTKPFTLTNNDYATVYNVTTVTNGNGTTVYVGYAYGNNGGVLCKVGDTTLDVKIAVDYTDWVRMATALSNLWV